MSSSSHLSNSPITGAVLAVSSAHQEWLTFWRPSQPRAREFFKGIEKLIPIDDVPISLHLQAHEHLDLWGNPCTPSGIYEKVKSLCSVSWLRCYSIFSKPVWAVGNQSLWIFYVYPVVYAAGSPVNLSALAGCWCGPLWIHRILQMPMQLGNFLRLQAGAMPWAVWCVPQAIPVQFFVMF